MSQSQVTIDVNLWNTQML